MFGIDSVNTNAHTQNHFLTINGFYFRSGVWENTSPVTNVTQSVINIDTPVSINGTLTIQDRNTITNVAIVDPAQAPLRVSGMSNAFYISFDIFCVSMFVCADACICVCRCVIILVLIVILFAGNATVKGTLTVTVDETGRRLLIAREQLPVLSVGQFNGAFDSVSVKSGYDYQNDIYKHVCARVCCVCCVRLCLHVCTCIKLTVPFILFSRDCEAPASTSQDEGLISVLLSSSSEFKCGKKKSKTMLIAIIAGMT